MKKQAQIFACFVLLSKNLLTSFEKNSGLWNISYSQIFTRTQEIEYKCDQSATFPSSQLNSKIFFKSKLFSLIVPSTGANFAKISGEVKILDYCSPTADSFTLFDLTY